MVFRQWASLVDRLPAYGIEICPNFFIRIRFTTYLQQFCGHCHRFRSGSVGRTGQHADAICSELYRTYCYFIVDLAQAKERPLVFIGHSLGGIVIKKVRCLNYSRFWLSGLLNPFRPLYWRTSNKIDIETFSHAQEALSFLVHLTRVLSSHAGPNTLAISSTLHLSARPWSGKNY